MITEVLKKGFSISYSVSPKGVFKREIKFLSKKWEKRNYHPAISHACRLSIYNVCAGFCKEPHKIWHVTKTVHANSYSSLKRSLGKKFDT